MWNIQKTVSKGEYIYAVVPEHPNRTKNNYVLLHRVVKENEIGRLLTNREIVHHKDENKKNNEPDNLEITNRPSHCKLHNSTGRLWVDFICPVCSIEFTRPHNKTIGKNINQIFFACSHSCRGKFSRKIQLKGKTEEINRAIEINVIRIYKKFAPVS